MKAMIYNFVYNFEYMCEMCFEYVHLVIFLNNRIIKQYIFICLNISILLQFYKIFHDKFNV